MAANRKAGRERVWQTKRVRGTCVDMCSVCVWVNEGQMVISGVLVTGRSDPPKGRGIRAPRPAQLWLGTHAILERGQGEMKARRAATTTFRRNSDATPRPVQGATSQPQLLWNHHCAWQWSALYHNAGPRRLQWVPTRHTSQDVPPGQSPDPSSGDSALQVPTLWV